MVDAAVMRFMGVACPENKYFFLKEAEKQDCVIWKY